MPTAIPAPEPRLSPRQTARFLWLCIRVRYLHRRMERASASARVSRVGYDKAGGRLLYFAERWLSCHAEAATILRCEEPPEVAEVRRLFEDAEAARRISAAAGLRDR